MMVYYIVHSLFEGTGCVSSGETNEIQHCSIKVNRHLMCYTCILHKLLNYLFDTSVTVALVLGH